MNKSEPNIQCSHETLNLDNSSKKNEIQKIFLISNSTLDELFNDTTHISLRWIYRSAKIHGTKKNPFEYIVPPPHKWGRNKYRSGKPEKIRIQNRGSLHPRVRLNCQKIPRTTSLTSSDPHFVPLVIRLRDCLVSTLKVFIGHKVNRKYKT